MNTITAESIFELINFDKIDELIPYKITGDILSLIIDEIEKIKNGKVNYIIGNSLKK